MRIIRFFPAFLLFFASLFPPLFAEEMDEKEKDDSVKDFGVSSFHYEAQYYGLPLSFSVGYLYRKNDFVLFPSVATSFNVSSTSPLLDIRGGFVLQQKFFRLSSYAVYDILPFTMNKDAGEQSVYNESIFSFTLRRLTLSFPFYAGRRARFLREDTQDERYIRRIVNEITMGVGMDFFLLDTGIFKSTGTSSLFVNYVSGGNFWDYGARADLLGTLYLYPFEAAFMYSFFHADVLKVKGREATEVYETGAAQSFLTGMVSFKNERRYNTLHFVKTELRFYPARFKLQANGFFFSLFLNTGLGITREGKSHFLYEAGGGIGYTLFDSVPFTFQAGINQDMRAVFFIGVVSTLTHRP